MTDAERLRKRALEAAKEALKWGESMLPPLSDADRATVREVLANHNEVVVVDGQDVRPGFKRLAVRARN